MLLLCAALLSLAPAPATPADLARYPWLEAGAPVRPLDQAFAAPAGFTRVPAAAGSFASFLRALPLRAEGAAVHLFDGSLARAAGDPGVAAVAALDVGARDLQQCADTVIRLHAEWLWAAGRAEALAYHFTSGDLARFSEHAAGTRPRVRGNRVRWEKRAAEPDGSRAVFRAWLDLVFTYAGTLSLQAETAPIARAQVEPGDVLVAGGSPGHAVLVLDVAADPAGRKVMLLGEGYTPAQELHVLRGAGGPWFAVSGDAVETPFWKPFPWSALRRLAVR